MKKLILKTAFAALFLATAIRCFGQCPTPNSGIYTVLYNQQSQIDEFPTKWPNCIDFEEQFKVSGDITDLAGLSQIKSFKKHFELKNLTSLTNLTGLENLQSVGGNLDFDFNPRLQDLTALSSLKMVGGDLEIGGCDSLKNLHGLEKLDSIVGSLFVGGCSGLKDLSGLNGLKTTGFLLLLSNDSLQSLKGLDALVKVSRSISMTRMKSLTDITALKNLTNLGQGLTFWDCDLLSDLSGVENLAQIGTDTTLPSGFGSLRIQGCPSLENLAAFKKLDFAISLWIFRNENLKSIDGLDSLKTVRFWLRISENPALENLHALANLKTVNDFISISNNDKLTSLHGTEGIDMTNLEELILQKSGMLSVCSQANICDYLKNGGAATIDSNLVGCNSVAEVLAGCAVPVGGFLGEKTAFEIFPNPISDGRPLQILLENDFLGKVKIELLALDGRVVSVFEKEKTAQKQVFELENLPSGNSFFVRISDKKKTETRLVLKR